MSSPRASRKAFTEIVQHGLLFWYESIQSEARLLLVRNPRRAKQGYQAGKESLSRAFRPRDKAEQARPVIKETATPMVEATAMRLPKPAVTPIATLRLETKIP